MHRRILLHRCDRHQLQIWPHLPREFVRQDLYDGHPRHRLRQNQKRDVCPHLAKRSSHLLAPTKHRSSRSRVQHDDEALQRYQRSPMRCRHRREIRLHENLRRQQGRRQQRRLRRAWLQMPPTARSELCDLFKVGKDGRALR